MWCRWTRVAGLVVVACVVAPVVAAAPGASAGSESESESETTVSVYRWPDGRLTVETGDEQPSVAAAGAGAGDEPTLIVVEPEIAVYAQVEGDPGLRSLAAEVDPLRADQWALDALLGVSNQPTVDRADGVVVAIVDSGVRADHEDLDAVIVGDIDLVSSGASDGSDRHHGTHVAGTVSAVVANGRGIQGLAGGAQVLSVRVLDGNGRGQSSNVARGIIAAVDRGADVINLSLGSPIESHAIAAAIDYAVSNDVVIVAAAGNAASMGNPRLWPAAHPDVLTVGAVDRDLDRSTFSSHGPHLDVVAPGRDVLSTGASTPIAYMSMTGTSMAAPHVTATVALIRAADPTLSQDQVRQIVRSTASDIGAPGVDQETGHGLVDPREAVTVARRGLASGDGDQTMVLRHVTSVGWVSDCPAVAGPSTSWPVGRFPIVGAAAAGPASYWTATSVGLVLPHDGARHLGDVAHMPLNLPIVGMAATPTGDGYWLVASDGGIFAFGDAGFHGSTGSIPLNQPIVGMAPTPTGHGYWLVASDGGIFAFGDAGFHGTRTDSGSSTATLLPAADGRGYVVISVDGRAAAFGSARVDALVRPYDPELQVVAALPC